MPENPLTMGGYIGAFSRGLQGMFKAKYPPGLFHVETHEGRRKRRNERKRQRRARRG